MRPSWTLTLFHQQQLDAPCTGTPSDITPERAIDARSSCPAQPGRAQ